MNPKDTETLLDRVKGGDALEFVRLDSHRERRLGVPEIVWGENKSPEQLVVIVRKMAEKSGLVLVSRLCEEKARALMEIFPQGRYHAEARIFVEGSRGFTPSMGRGKILVVAAGTSDLSVAQEAALTAQLLGNEVDRIYDVGVAGIHRLLGEVPRLREAAVLIVVAGMEGALPSVVAGLVGRPIIAVPTSVGYGTGLGGFSALLTMLNGCAPGVTVVNIDNGVGAAVAAHLMNRHV